MQCSASPEPASVADGADHVRAPASVPFNRRFECTDADALAEHMTGWALQFDQLSPGPFHGTLHEIRVEGVQLLRERVDRALLKRGAAAPRTTSISIALETAGTGFCGGTLLQDRIVLVSSGPSMPELRTPERHDIAVLTVPTEALQALASLDEADIDALAPGRTWLVKLSGPRYEALKAFVLTSFYNAERAHGALAWPQARKTLHDALLLELVDVARHPPEPACPNSAARRRIVDRVRELAIAKQDAPLTVLDVCKAVGASRRKLQYCFEETLGTHPAYYLRVLRLNAVRRELRRHSPTTACVSDIAYQWGFWHLSRFATHYRQLFGELPSETLKRAPR
jgi:AraC family ethanolamine operon transcriptional activator